MPNMSYARFRNTYSDLLDCYYHLDDEELSPAESEAREALITLCQSIVEEHSNES